MARRAARRPISPNVEPCQLVAAAVLDWCAFDGQPATAERVTTMAHRMRRARQITRMPPVAGVFLIMRRTARHRGVDVPAYHRPTAPTADLPPGVAAGVAAAAPIDLDAL